MQYKEIKIPELTTCCQKKGAKGLMICAAPRALR